ncbi:MAG TPA: hypothetical protein VMU42_14675 [Candidatus Sulfotelmatobacter sp.]|nr:hypothetical protein [Candidatus Sulfotelmatobacter sp.]
MASPYLERPVRSLAQAIEEIARDRRISAEELYRQSGSAAPSPAKPAVQRTEKNS